MARKEVPRGSYPFIGRGDAGLRSHEVPEKAAQAKKAAEWAKEETRKTGRAMEEIHRTLMGQK
jgi:hypothetical protein